MKAITFAGPLAFTLFAVAAAQPLAQTSGEEGVAQPEQPQGDAGSSGGDASQSSGAGAPPGRGGHGHGHGGKGGFKGMIGRGMDKMRDRGRSMGRAFNAMKQAMRGGGGSGRNKRGRRMVRFVKRSALPIAAADPSPWEKMDGRGKGRGHGTGSSHDENKQPGQHHRMVKRSAEPHGNKPGHDEGPKDGPHESHEHRLVRRNAAAEPTRPRREDKKGRGDNRGRLMKREAEADPVAGSWGGGNRNGGRSRDANGGQDKRMNWRGGNKPNDKGGD